LHAYDELLLFMASEHVNADAPLGRIAQSSHTGIVRFLSILRSAVRNV
jgi:hypothetical protein